jgi:uncharacterized protein (TIGR02996 family)
MIQQSLFDNDFDSPLRRSLEAALVENPDDLAAHMAYADHLTELGDPRGELIQIQLALEDEKLSAEQRRPLLEREGQLLSQHWRSWVGDLSLFTVETQEPYERSTVGFRRGWIDSLTIANLTAPLTHALDRQQGALRLLRELRIIDGDSPAYSDEPMFDAFRRANIFRNVRIFHVGSPDYNPQFTEDDEIGQLIEKMPRIEELSLCTADLDTSRLFGLPMPHLRKLTVHHQTHYALETLAANASLSDVTHLAFWPHALVPREEDAYLTRDGIRAVLHAPAFRNLTYLQLRLTDMGDDLIRELIAQDRFKTLKVLDLWGGRITDAGARLLAECRDARSLEALELSYNALTETGLAELRQAHIPVTAAHQHTQQDLNERQHLYWGDIE